MDSRVSGMAWTKFCSVQTFPDHVFAVWPAPAPWLVRPKGAAKSGTASRKERQEGFTRVAQLQILVEKHAARLLIDKLLVVQPH